MRAAILALATLSEVSSQIGAPYARVRDARREPEHWLTYSGDYHGTRYSTLQQITRETVSRLRPAWVYQVEKRGPIKASPIVLDGMLYITEPPDTVTALDPLTGRVLWRYAHVADRTTAAWPNRGVAIANKLVIFGTQDAHLVALDAATGRRRWEKVVADHRQGYAISAAPLFVQDKVIVGATGGETGIRGFLDAYLVATGERAWRFWTVPGPGQPGHETWGGDSWKTGGAPGWVTGSFDPELNLIYWGIGNPAPPLNGDRRPGDNLFSSSLVALDAARGTLRWHFQFTPHDVWDWDSCHVPVLVNRPIQGRQAKLALLANKNGFYYVFDRANGHLLAAKQFAQQDWADGLDAKGRPIVKKHAVPKEEWTPVRPSFVGATNWYSPTFHPETGLFYVVVRDVGGRVRKAADRHVRGETYWGGAAILDSPDEGGVVRALHAATGDFQWEFRMKSPSTSGLLSTAGGLLFGGTTEGNVFALDVESGAPLWHFQAGGAVNSNPITYAFRGRQYMLIAAGQCLIAFAL